MTLSSSTSGHYGSRTAASGGVLSITVYIGRRHNLVGDVSKVHGSSVRGCMTLRILLIRVDHRVRSMCSMSDSDKPLPIRKK